MESDLGSIQASLTGEQAGMLETYSQLLLEWNQRFNLTAFDTHELVWNRHFLDSLTCLRVMQGTPMDRVVDVGTGAGFPGLVLKIVRPEMRLTLVESVRKKADFCAHLVAQLNLGGVDIQVGRAETVARMAEHREQYDWSLARAVAPMRVLVEYMLPFVKLGGRMLAQKGPQGRQETSAATAAIQILGGQLETMLDLRLPAGGGEPPAKRTLIIVRKTTRTPEKYPRRPGIPAKRPL